NCRAVQVGFAINANSFVRLASIGATSETIQDLLNPSVRCRPELKHCATSMIAAKHCGAVNISAAVYLKISVGVFAVVLFETEDDICRRRRSGDERQRDNE